MAEIAAKTCKELREKSGKAGEQDAKSICRQR